MKDEEIVNLCTGDRYVMYKIGPVLMANVRVFFCSDNQPLYTSLQNEILYEKFDMQTFLIIHDLRRLQEFLVLK